MSDERFILKNARHLAARYMERFCGRAISWTRRWATAGTRSFCANWSAKRGASTLLMCREALERTAARLEAAGLRARATLILAGHETMKENVPVSPRAVMFNLGWLPGAAHIVTTRTETTMRAVQAALELVQPDGFVSICVYPGHEEGTRELHALLAWAAGLDVRLQRAAPQPSPPKAAPSAPSDSEKRMTFKRTCDKTLTNSPGGRFCAKQGCEKRLKKFLLIFFCKKQKEIGRICGMKEKRDKLYLSMHCRLTMHAGPYTITGGDSGMSNFRISARCSRASRLFSKRVPLALSNRRRAASRLRASALRCCWTAAASSSRACSRRTPGVRPEAAR